MYSLLHSMVPRFLRLYLPLPEHEVLLQPRSPHWKALRRKWLAANPTCAGCGTKQFLQVHHKMPVSWDVIRELEWDNLMTLCESPEWMCHLRLGHSGSWLSRNPQAEKTAEEQLYRIEHRPVRPIIAA